MRARAFFMGSFIAWLIILVISASVVSGEEPGVTVETVINDNPVVSSAPSLIITSPQKVTAFIDTSNLPTKTWHDVLSSPATLFALTNNDEFQHALPSLDGYPGKRLIFKTGVIESGDMRIEGIKAGRFDDSVDGSNIIFIIDAAGYRIVHFGDCGQERLTPEQVKKIGRVDLALYAIEWANSDLSVANKKAFRVLRQVNPTILIPTHIASSTAVGEIGRTWPGEIVASGKFLLDRRALTRKRSVFWGDNLAIARKCKLPEFRE